MLAETRAEMQAEIQAETQAEMQTEIQAETRAETQVETRAETQAEIQAEIQAETQVETQAEMSAETRVETQGRDLPEEFLRKMEGLLGEEYGAFLESFGGERAKGLRLNPLKVTQGRQREALAERFGLRPIPWAREGYYYDDTARPGKHVFHEAGVFYIQEPSAMAAVELLDPRPGDKVLDLCAAPGGKTTQIGGRLQGQGFLLSNEIHPARARILAQNVERMGIANAVVSNESPQTLARHFPGFFDKILVDAPCSGEGMFRKDEEARRQWSPDNVRRCAKRQQEILAEAAAMLKPGGRMVYSTCTFSPEENERNIETFLEGNPDFSVEGAQGRSGISRGRPEWSAKGLKTLSGTFRIWPHRSEGEGHYLAVLKKNPESEGIRLRKMPKPVYAADRQVRAAWQSFAKETLTEEGLRVLGDEAQGRLALFGSRLCWMAEAIPEVCGLKVLSRGLLLGTFKKNRLEPAHALALYLRKEQVKRWNSEEAASSRLAAYLRGETLTVTEGSAGYGEKGWALMLAEGYSVGWARQVEETWKNHYPKGLRKTGTFTYTRER